MNPIKSVGRILLATGLIGVILLAAAGEASARHRPPARQNSTADKAFQEGFLPPPVFNCRFLDRLGQVRFHNYACSEGMTLNEVLKPAGDRAGFTGWQGLAAPEQFSCRAHDGGATADLYNCRYTLVNAKHCVSSYRFTLDQMASTNDKDADDASNGVLVVWYPLASPPVSTTCHASTEDKELTAAVPAGGVNTGGGGSITGGGSGTPLIAGGAAALIAGAGLVLLTFRRRQRHRAA